MCVLTKLEVSNLAIIEKLSIDFSRGFNVITGETGAGKSILIKALQLILGGKAASGVVRKEAKLASVTACFEVAEGHLAYGVLESLGIAVESSEILIRRTITAKGRSQAWVNDTLVTATALKKLGATLVDIFGQHDSSRLLDPNKHYELLDQFVEAEVRDRFKCGFNQFEHLFSDVKALLKEYVSLSSQADYLEYRKNELDEFKPDVQEYTELLNESRQLRERAKVRGEVASVSDLLNSPVGLLRSVDQLKRSLPGLSAVITDSERRCEQLDELQSLLDEMGFDIARWLTDANASLTSQESLESRISKYQDLFRKTDTSNIDQLVSYQCELEGELKKISIIEGELEQKTSDLTKLIDQVVKYAACLTDARKVAADKVAKDVAMELDALAMSGARISMEFIPVSNKFMLEHFDRLERSLQGEWADAIDKLSGVGSYGAEKPVIHLASNPGENPQPLERIASGGEVSRIMLSLKKVLSSGADACVLVFDEVDAGISGEVATRVGSKLKELSSSFQIICISHLAQVASFGDRHFKVAKAQESGRTYTSITQLGDEKSTEEIARLMSGEGVTNASIQHARILKNKAQVVG
jgi:DNA repair protein RecN (Recombination protein N)